MKFKVKSTIDPSRLAEYFPKFVKDTLGALSDVVIDSAKNGLDKGRDVHGNQFKPIQESTKKVRTLRGRPSNKPLVDTGAMKNSFKINKQGRKSTITAEGYGNASNKNVHQTGYKVANNPKIKGKIFYFKGKNVPKREWFPTKSSVAHNKKINQDWKDDMKPHLNKINERFTKK